MGMGRINGCVPTSIICVRVLICFNTDNFRLPIGNTASDFSEGGSSGVVQDAIYAPHPDATYNTVPLESALPNMQNCCKLAIGRSCTTARVAMCL